MKILIKKFVLRILYFIYASRIKKLFQIRYINLDHRQDRRKHMEDLQKQLNLPFQRITASSYKTVLEPNEYVKEILKRGIETYILSEDGKIARPGIIGCYLSHLQSIENMDATYPGVYITLEDDINIAGIHFFIKLLKILKKTPTDWDILLVDCAGKYNTSQLVVRNLYLPNNTNELVGTHVVLIKPQSKNKIIKGLAAYPIKDIDGLLLSNKTQIKTYVAKTGLSYAGGFKPDRGKTII